METVEVSHDYQAVRAGLHLPKRSTPPFKKEERPVFAIPIVPGFVRRAVIAFAAALLLFACTVALVPRADAADPAVGASVWHRLNPNAPGFAPQHISGLLVSTIRCSRRVERTSHRSRV